MQTFTGRKKIDVVEKTMAAILLVVFSLLLGEINSVDEVHSLSYIYTALSKTVNIPGVYEFTAMGLLDGKQIDYYNSKEKVKVPRMHWMKESQTAEYWTKGTESRKSKEQWFKVNIKILMERMKQNNSDIHVLQWRHGCEAVRQPDGNLRFQRGFNLYSYNGDDFLSFDVANSQWVAPVEQAKMTKDKWDASPTLNPYTRDYLQKECMVWLDKFTSYCEEDTKKQSKLAPPDVFAFAKQSQQRDNLSLTFMVTGFYPKGVELEIYRGEQRLDNGVLSTEVRPNDDETYQLRKTVEVLKSDKEKFSGKVHHRALEKDIIFSWDGKCFDSPGSLLAVTGPAVTIPIILLVIVIGIILFVLFKKRILDSCQSRGPVPNNGNNQQNGHQSNPANNDVELPLMKEEPVILNIPTDAQAPEVKEGSKQSLDSGHSTASSLNSGRSLPEEEKLVQSSSDSTGHSAENVTQVEE